MKYNLIAFTFAILVSSFAGAAVETEISSAGQVAHDTASHTHGGPGCTHEAVKHGNHTDYIHDGQRHALHGVHFDNHGDVAKLGTTPDLKLANHDHKHGKNCGHRAVPHGNHTDYDHDGHLHAVHGDHFDDHSVAANN